MAGDKKKNQNKSDHNFPDSQTATLNTPVYELKRGMKFAGRYEVIEELGRGGMGKVYRVEDTKIQEEIALKLLKPEISIDKNHIERFSNEIKLARKISHRNVCRMYHFGEEKGLYYITMEYVHGEDLKSTMKRVGILNAGKAIFIAKQIGEGLWEAHNLGIIHRDLKPQNIMIDKQGNVRIMDFGVARFVKGKGITDAGTVIGTPEYMSPEQASAKDVDRRTDLYSLGVILYEMITGQPPFSGETALSVAIKHKSEKPKPPKEINAQIPDDLNHLILKCLEKDKQRRYQDVHELLAELKKIEEGIPTTERVMPKTRPFTSKEITVKFNLRKVLVTVSLIVLAGIIGLASWKWIFEKETDKELPIKSTFTDESIKKINSFALGEKLLQKNKLGQALEQFQKVLEENPGDIEACLNTAFVLKKQGKTEEAVSHYKRAVEIDPSDPRPYKHLASLYERNNDLIKARSFYQKYLEIAPRNEEYTQVEELIKELEGRIRAEEPVIKKDKKSKPQKQIEKPTKEKQVPEARAHKKAQPKEEKSPESQDIKKPQEIREKTQPQVSDKIEAGINEFEKENYEKSLLILNEVLEVDPDNPKAKEYRVLSENKIAQQDIKHIVNEYQNSLQNNSLVSFYQKNSTQELYQEIKKDAEWIIQAYDELQSFISEVTIEFKEETYRAEANISLIITGVSKKDGIKQSLFEGIYSWQMKKHNSQWKITKVSSHPTNK